MIRVLCSIFFLLLGVHTTVYSQEKSRVAIHSDPRLAVLIKKNQAISKQNHSDASKGKIVQSRQKAKGGHKYPILASSNGTYEGKGFRVQIYNGPDRAKANRIRDEFSKYYPAVHTYLIYVSPYFRVKVGDYKNRSDAMGMYREASSSYYPCMIVPDEVSIK